MLGGAGREELIGGNGDDNLDPGAGAGIIDVVVLDNVHGRHVDDLAHSGSLIV